MSTFSTCTSSTRPGSPTDGDVLFETDTKNVIIWEGGTWIGYQFDTATGWSGSNAYYLAFDGVDDDLRATTYDAGNEVASTGSLSTSGWFNIPTAQIGNFTQIFYLGDSGVSSNYFGLNVQSDSTLRFSSRKGGSGGLFISSTNTISADTWYNYVVVRSYSGTTCTITLYVNGTQWATGSAVNHNFAIGSLTLWGGFRGDFFYQSRQDEMAIYETALTLGQAANIYKGESNGGSGGTNGTVGNLLSFNPVVWLRCGDGVENGSGDTVYDMSSYNFYATRNGAAYTAY
jgi:hypothetical protein